MGVIKRILKSFFTRPAPKVQKKAEKLSILCKDLRKLLGKFNDARNAITPAQCDEVITVLEKFELLIKFTQPQLCQQITELRFLVGDYKCLCTSSTAQARKMRTKVVLEMEFILYEPVW